MNHAGFKLDYFSPIEVAGEKIEKIDYEDIESEIAYWSFAIVCYVLGANPPSCVFNGFIHKIWGKYGIQKITSLKTGITLVKFDSIAIRDEVIQTGMVHFDKKPVVIKPWTHDVELTKERMTSVPVWVKIHGLDVKYWSATRLGKIRSLLGRPIRVDDNTQGKIGINFARILVEVEIGYTLKQSIHFKNEVGVLIEQNIEYEWKPVKYNCC